MSKLLKEDDYNKIIGTDKKSYEDFQKDLLNPKTWAEEIMIRWTSKMLGVNIVFMNLSNEANTMYCGMHDENTVKFEKQCRDSKIPTVIVAWIAQSHFETIVRIDEKDDHHVKFTAKFDPVKDAETIKSIMSAYIMKCKL